uniref:SPOR domain-containing protein n=1 Tax=Ningiella ruwaisensis TaxID=2364274 RepID=UPI00109F013D|nr:SPOR domain-containing protein [Ningiella ruwaisensis]
MPPTDYVSRGQKRKSNATRRKQKKPTRPWLRIILAVAILFALGFGLYTLQSLPTKDDSANTSTEINEAELNSGVSDKASTSNESNGSSVQSDVEFNKSSLEKDPLPKLGEEEWAFIDALPEYSVQVDIPEQVDSNKIYIMQCGSFRTTDRAQELRAIIALQGLEAEMLESNGANGRWYRVVLGPYDRKRAAERDRHQLRRANVNNCKIY